MSPGNPGTKPLPFFYSISAGGLQRFSSNSLTVVFWFYIPTFGIEYRQGRSPKAGLLSCGRTHPVNPEGGDTSSSDKDRDKHQGARLGRMIALVLAAVRLWPNCASYKPFRTTAGPSRSESSSETSYKGLILQVGT